LIFFVKYAAILDLQKAWRLQSPTMRFNWPATKRMIRLYFAVFILLWWGGLKAELASNFLTDGRAFLTAEELTSFTVSS